MNKQDDTCPECGELWNSEYHISDVCVKGEGYIDKELFDNGVECCEECK